MSLDAANADQADYWNGAGGRSWADLQENQDRFLAPVAEALIEAAAPARGEAALDVGCGAGATTLAVAAATGRALGIDISGPMLARARERAAAQNSPARFELADATVHDFSGEAADLTISRFGVMFFADPARAFGNLRRGMKQGARLAFVCWREPKLNPCLLLAYSATLKHAPPLPKPAPEDPGPFSFAEPARVRRVLEAAGFAGVTLTPRDYQLDVGCGEGLDTAVANSLRIGPASRALAGQPEEVRAAATEEIRAAFTERLSGGKIPLDAAVWIVQATA